jgi:hypothetical protein
MKRSFYFIHNFIYEVFCSFFYHTNIDDMKHKVGGQKEDCIISKRQEQILLKIFKNFSKSNKDRLLLINKIFHLCYKTTMNVDKGLIKN